MESKSRLTDFEIQTKLGSGSYGVIYRVVRRADRKVYVLKQVNLGNMKEKMRKNVPSPKLRRPSTRQPYCPGLQTHSLCAILKASSIRIA